MSAYGINVNTQLKTSDCCMKISLELCCNWKLHIFWPSMLEVLLKHWYALKCDTTFLFHYFQRDGVSEWSSDEKKKITHMSCIWNRFWGGSRRAHEEGKATWGKVKMVRMITGPACGGLNWRRGGSFFKDKLWISKVTVLSNFFKANCYVVRKFRGRIFSHLWGAVCPSVARLGQAGPGRTESVHAGYR